MSETADRAACICLSLPMTTGPENADQTQSRKDWNSLPDDINLHLQKTPRDMTEKNESKSGHILWRGRGPYLLVELAPLHDDLDLVSGQGLILEQRGRYSLQLVAVLGEDRPRVFVCSLAQPLHLLVNETLGLRAVRLVVSVEDKTDLRAEKNRACVIVQGQKQKEVLHAAHDVNMEL